MQMKLTLLVSKVKNTVKFKAGSDRQIKSAECQKKESAKFSIFRPNAGWGRVPDAGWVGG